MYNFSLGSVIGAVANPGLTTVDNQQAKEYYTFRRDDLQRTEEFRS